MIELLHLFLTLFDKIKITKSGKLNKSCTRSNSDEALLADRSSRKTTIKMIVRDIEARAQKGTRIESP